MRERPAARLIIVDPFKRVLLFLFDHKSGALAGEAYWATPGGALEPGEDFEMAAQRELFEETGLRLPILGVVATRRHVFVVHDGEKARGVEELFLVRSENQLIDTRNWTELERRLMVDWRWWSAAELESTDETYYPEELAVLVNALN